MSTEGLVEEKGKEKAKLHVSEIIVLPNYAKLKDEVEKLRKKLIKLVFERDELSYTICKNIETKYLLMFGSLEYKAYELECETLRLKRKMELIRAKKNRQEMVIITQIEKTLDIEFEEYKQKQTEQMDKMNDAIKRNKGHRLSDEEDKEFKKCYRNIIKALHPDLHPENTSAQTTLLENAINAYKEGDLETIRIISEMVCETNIPDNHIDAMTQLVNEEKRLKNLLLNIKEDIKKIKSEYPYTVKEIVTDPKLSKKRKADLLDLISQYNELISSYTANINEMLEVI
ncbi:MAG: molecular chaperone DnaJ [Clostridia bacterium]